MSGPKSIGLGWARSDLSSRGTTRNQFELATRLQERQDFQVTADSFP